MRVRKRFWSGLCSNTIVLRIVRFNETKDRVVAVVKMRERQVTQ